MALTEEEKLKKQSKQAMSLDDWYNTSKSRLDQSRQNQLEDAYVNQQLLEKYLPERLAQQGIENTGVAELYRQQANNNYINNRASINQNYNDSLYNLDTSYYTQKKAEQDKVDAELKERQQALYNVYANRIDNSVNDYGFIDDESRDLLSQYINSNKDNLGDYASMLDSRLGMYAGTSTQRNAMYGDNYNEYMADLTSRLGDKTGLTDDEYDFLVNELESNKTQLGEANYEKVKSLLNQYKTANQLQEKVQNSLNNYGLIEKSDATDIILFLQSELQNGNITKSDYDEAVDAVKSKTIDNINIKDENYQKQLYRNIYDAETHSEASKAFKEYRDLSEDAPLEKALKLFGAGTVQLGKRIGSFFKNVFWN